MSNSEKREDSRKDNDSPDDVSQDQFEKSDINLKRTINENLPPFMIKLASENNHLYFSRSLEVSNQLSNQPPTLLSQAPNIDKLDENTDVDSSRQRGGLPSCSQNNYPVSPRQHAEISPMSALQDSEIRESKTSQKDMSHLSCGRKADFTSPPEQGSVSMIKSLSQNLNEVNTPSPEKRGFRSEAVSPPIKRLRKTPENDSSKPGSKTESYRSNLSNSAPVKIPHTSPINLRIQQTEGAVHINEETGYMSTPSIGKARKENVIRNNSLQSEKAANNQSLPITISYVTSLANAKIDENRSDSSIRTSTLYTHSRSESTEVFDFSRRGLHRRSASDGALTSRYLNEVKTEQEQTDSSIDSSRNEPEMARRINPLSIPAAEGQASTSRGSIVNSRSSINSLDTSSGEPPTSDSSHTENAGERARNMFRNSEYIVESRHLLQWILKEIMQINGQVDFWRKFEKLFNLISSNCAEVEYFFLSYKLEQYRADRGYTLWLRSLDSIRELNALTSTAVAYERFVSVVVRTLALTLGVETEDSYFNLFLSQYSKLVNLYNEFLRNSNIYSVEDMQDEASRNCVKTLKKKFENLRLLTLSAFRLLLMFIGENSDEESIGRFEFFHVIDEEDRKFLRRNNS